MLALPRKPTGATAARLAAESAARAAPPTPAHDDRFPCPRCAEHFDSRVRLAGHLKDEHRSAAGFLCVECTFSCHELSDLQSHMRTDHYDPFATTEQKCRTGQCTYGTLKANVLSLHKKHDHHELTDHPVFACSKCKSYNNSSVVGISTHMLHWHSEVQRCETCDMIFGEPNEQMAHTQEICQANKTLADYEYTPGVPLPDHVFPDGWSLADFDPTTLYMSAANTPSMYRSFPPSIPDALLFSADPKLLYGENFLRLAVKFTNTEIRERINAGRTRAVIDRNDVIARRITGALRTRANNSDLPYTEIKTAFDQVRDQATSKGSKKQKRKKSDDDERDDAQQNPGKRMRASKHTGEDLSAPGAPSDNPPPDDAVINASHDAFLKEQLSLLNALTPEELVYHNTSKKRPSKRKAAQAARSLPAAAALAASPAKAPTTLAAADKTAPVTTLLADTIAGASNHEGDRVDGGADDEDLDWEDVELTTTRGNQAKSVSKPAAATKQASGIPPAGQAVAPIPTTQDGSAVAGATSTVPSDVIDLTED